MIEIVPAIDIIDGKCVRLSKGDYDQKKVYDASPLDMAKSYFDCGVKRIHMVDLDGAKISAPANLKVLEQVASQVSCEIEWGGGISSSEALGSVFDAGASNAVVGSVAALKPELFELWLDSFGASKMVLGADVKNGLIAVKGWLETAQLSIDDLVSRFLKRGLSQVICTEISRDGMLQGPADELYVRLQSAFPEVIFTVSGGISSMADIERLNGLGLKKVIVGKAIYENRITLKDIERWSLNV
ncbi:MAG: 1-(5-phosphoribosyl)-5-[(5-phosphoribosylamino)methylideneamino]imidazole-4-carboxamide isomerase [Bacteroidales bacterium]|nr:1-(5-phosphoribosyl)-5-[(5-phosphoribosylamino)methylideneamino]imidazole-4-carboxamide isomerase [Bacteroidales bacterium]